ncbi:MAG: GAF domain-containing protein [Ktedonobacteraceae bacterium]
MSHEEDVGVIRRQRGRPPKFNNALQTDVSLDVSLIEGEQRGQHRQALDIDVERGDEALSTARETFTGALNTPFSNVREVKKDIYHDVLELLATIVDEETRRWQIILAIFEYALVQMDAERHGIAITYAALMPARSGAIHSLYEVAMRGTEPWPFSFDGQAYLGSTTLAGTAAIEQRMLIWDSVDETVRWQVEVDEFEKSACACPVTRGGRIAGVLIISSSQPGFFTNDVTCQAVVEYAYLLALAFSGDSFQPYSQLHLMPMPPLKKQREEIRETLMYRIMSLARTAGLSRPEAATRIRSILEQEFEERMQSQRE